jgi:hypothetical protein
MPSYATGFHDSGNCLMCPVYASPVITSLWVPKTGSLRLFSGAPILDFDLIHETRL